MTRLTLRRLEAIAEALGARLAGEMDLPSDDPETPRKADYEAAERWAFDQINKRKAALAEVAREDH